MNPPAIVAEAPEQIVINLKNLVCSNWSIIQKTKEELKNAREAILTACENNQDFGKLKAAEKDARKKKNAIVEAIKNDNPTMADKITELSKTIKETKEALSDYTSEYFRMSGQTEIETPDGTKLEIKKKFTVEQMKLL